MHYDAIIIGAGMSGLAVGIRLAMYDRKVCIVERHDVYGGLNSFYTLDGRQFDVGLHALTNFVPPGARSAPLSKMLRQLRLSREVLDLCEQRFSEVRFPGRRLRFSNDIELLIQDVADQFPGEIDNFHKLIEDVKSYDDLSYDVKPRSTREALATYFRDQTLIEMILCPLMYYGCAQENDMDYTQFVTMFKSIFCEGFARPRNGVRTIIRELVKKYRACGGEFKMKCGVDSMHNNGRRVTGVTLDNGETWTAGAIFSSAGYPETMQMCSDDGETPQAEEVGRLSFMESISILDNTPAEIGLDSTILFFNDADTFTYARPEGLIDTRSGVVCCPNNFDKHDELSEGVIRLTSLANYDCWVSLDEKTYQQQKHECYQQVVDRAIAFIPEFRDRVVCMDIFTPRTIHRYTGRIDGAVYGAPRKIRDGRTPLENLFICGTDQGFLGIIGALLSGISMANLHVLGK